MRIAMTLLTLVWTGTAFAGPLSYQDGVLRIAQMGSKRSRSIWARNKSLVLVFAAREGTESQRLKIDDGIIREARLTSRANRVEVELRLDQRAESLLGRLRIAEDDGDLTVKLAPLQLPQLYVAPKVKQKETVPAAKATTASSSPASTDKPKADRPSTLATTTATRAKTKHAAKKASPLVDWRKQVAKAGAKDGGASLGGAPWLLAILVLAGAAAAYWLRRRQGVGTAAPVHINVVSSRALSGRHKLVLVEAAGEMMLLGCTDKEVRMLRALDSNAAETGETAAMNDSLDALLMGARPQPPQPTSAVTQHAPAAASIPAVVAQTTQAQHVEQPLAVAPRQPAAPLPTQVAAPSAGTPQMARFVDQLTQQIQSRQASQLPAQESGPLDEKWAEGILRLRRNRQRDQVTLSNRAIH